MSYTVRSSERTRSSAAEHETKALLYLMNFRPDSDDIYYFVVDFFNDLTGMDNMAVRLWDLQSKGAHGVGPKEIGKELVTLFQNYMSGLSFKAYILFVGSVSKTLRIDPSLTVFGIDNVKGSAIRLIKEGLRAEGEAKSYICNTDLTDANIDSFLQAVQFVIDDGKAPSDYVKAIIKNHPNIPSDEKVLTAIFNEIRDKQSSKKNVSRVEGLTIETTEDALSYCRHLTTNEIRALTLQRIINRYPLGKGVPMSFLPIFNSWPPEQQNDLFEECQMSWSRALFNKNAADDFWFLFENTYQLIVTYPKETVQELFARLKTVPNCVSRCHDFDVFSLEYFISIIKDGIQQ